jgi:2-amino-4-hydroxy-6-hydroxymethyldihydropteridine diphosphokinase
MREPGATKVNDAWIALGSNLGEREATLARAVELLGRRGVDPVRVSHLYETRPEGGKPEPMYLNAVMQARTELDPHRLLDVLHQVESELGRGLRRTGPRTCDLDLLALGDLVVEESPDLRLPHPRLQDRSFVLVPLCELDVHWRHPALSRSAGEMLAALTTSPGEVRLHARAPERDEAPATSTRRP